MPLLAANIDERNMMDVIGRFCISGVLAVFYAIGGKEFVLLLPALMVINYSAGSGSADPRRSQPEKTSRHRLRGPPHARNVMRAAVAASLEVPAG